MIRPLDLRLRLLSAFILVLALSQLRDLAAAFLALVVIVLATLALDRDRSAWRRLVHVEMFVVLLFLSLPFTVPGAPFLTLGPLTASVEGISRAALVACKVAASVLAIQALLAGIEPDRLGGALRSLWLPEPIVRLFVLTARYLGIIRDEGRRLHEAMRARGFRPGSSRHTWRSYGNLIGMLLVRALERAERVEEAMRCRGYAGRFPYAAPPRPAARDWGRFAVILGTAVAVSLVDRAWT
jgi:cobalt/nickel transport system permease protein